MTDACILKYSDCRTGFLLLPVDWYIEVGSVTPYQVGCQTLKNHVAYRAFAVRCQRICTLHSLLRRLSSGFLPNWQNLETESEFLNGPPPLTLARQCLDPQSSGVEVIGTHGMTSVVRLA